CELLLPVLSDSPSTDPLLTKLYYGETFCFSLRGRRLLQSLCRPFSCSMEELLGAFFFL
ncbi:Gibberellin receptor GID1, partial [Dissostichus eleginoides]